MDPALIVGSGASWRSSTTTSTPAIASSAATSRPVGPAPTTATWWSESGAVVALPVVLMSIIASPENLSVIRNGSTIFISVKVCSVTKINRQLVVAGALELLDEVGLDRVSTRRLAQRLG